MMKDKVWDSYWLSGRKQFFLHFIRYFQDYLFTKKIKCVKNSRILEAGCGTGMSLSMLQKKYRVVGFDISKEVVKAARGRCKNVFVADVKKLPFKDRSFDLIFAQGMLEHFTIEDIKKTVDEMSRISNHVMTTVPRKNGSIDIASRIYKFFGLKWIFPDEEYYDEDFLTSLLKKYRLKIENFFFYCFYLITINSE